MSLFARLNELYIERDYIYTTWYRREPLSEFRIYNWHLISIVYSQILVVMTLLKSRYPMYVGLNEGISYYKSRRRAVRVFQTLTRCVLKTRFKRILLHIMQDKVFKEIENIHNHIITFLV